MLGSGQIGHIDRMHRFFVCLLFARAWIGQKKSVVLMAGGGGEKWPATIISGFMPPGRGSCAGVWSCSEHAIFLLAFSTGSWIGQAGYKAVVTGEGSVRIINFITIGAGGSCTRAWQCRSL